MTDTAKIIMAASSALITKGKITTDDFKSSITGFTPETLETEILKIRDDITTEKRKEGVVIVDGNMFLNAAIERFFNAK